MTIIISTVEINNIGLFSSHCPARNGLFDARMGANVQEDGMMMIWACGTCGRKTCKGHFGHVILAAAAAAAAQLELSILPVLPPSMGRWVKDGRVDRMTQYVGDIVISNNAFVFERNLGLSDDAKNLTRLKKDVVEYVAYLKAEHGIDVHHSKIVLRPRSDPKCDDNDDATLHNDAKSLQRRVLMLCHGEKDSIRRDSVLLNIDMEFTVEEVKAVKAIDIDPTSRPTLVADLTKELKRGQLESLGVFDCITLEYPTTSMYISSQGVLVKQVFTNVARLLDSGGTFAMPIIFNKDRHRKQIVKNIEMASELTFVKSSRSDKLLVEFVKCVGPPPSVYEEITNSPKMI